MLKTLCNGLCDLVYPPLCILCKKYLFTEDRSTVLCPACETHIEQNLPPFCPKCSRHLEKNTASGPCAQCRDYQPYFDSAVGVCAYNSTMRKLIHLFKYGNKLALRHPFSKIIRTFTDTYAKDMRQYDIVTAVPLHPHDCANADTTKAIFWPRRSQRHFISPFARGILSAPSTPSFRPVIPERSLDKHPRGI